MSILKEPHAILRLGYGLAALDGVRDLLNAAMERPLVNVKSDNLNTLLGLIGDFCQEAHEEVKQQLFEMQPAVPIPPPLPQLPPMRQGRKKPGAQARKRRA